MDTILNFFSQGTSFILPFIILLGVLIFVHELGHFSVAKFFGVRVEVFSLGFGRKILQKKVGDTVYCISMIPFGGYVKMFGDDFTAPISTEEQKYSFSHKPVLQRIAVVLAGPLMNAFFALFLFIIIAAVGEEVLSARVGDVFPGSAAYQAGFRTDDTLKLVNGTPIDRWDTFKKLIEENHGKQSTIVVNRDGKEFPLQVTPQPITNKNILSSATHVGDIEGLTYLKRASAIGVNNPLSSGSRSGLRTGDIVRKIDGKEISIWSELESALIQAEQKSQPTVALEIERAGNPKLQITLEIEKGNPLSGLEPSDLYLSSVISKSAAEEAGIQLGDKLISIAGHKLQRWEDVVKIVQGYKETDGALKVEYFRSGKLMSANVTPRLLKQTDNTGVEQQNYALGVVTGLVFATPETFIAKEANPGNMFARGFNDTVHWTKLTVLSFVKLAQGKVSTKSIGGPLMIGKLASDTWRIGVSPFLKIMAIISINLFILNLLPIPVLDGGHLLFYTIEFFKGTPLSFRKIEAMQQVGMFLLLALMVFSMFNDIVRFFAS
ncbi:MAG: RIP metalloprotease RseP [Oligoflexia bacterium]|nr:RIP metalloprotease RseP [Oligoflexia bacterium]